MCKFTTEEKRIIRQALRIASEDGSIFGGDERQSRTAKVGRIIDSISAKLDGARQQKGQT